MRLRHRIWLSGLYTASLWATTTEYSCYSVISFAFACFAGTFFFMGIPDTSSILDEARGRKVLPAAKVVSK